MADLPLGILVTCQGCGEPLHTAGVRGLCSQCLVASTVGHPADLAEAGGREFEETLHYGAMVGVGGRFLLLDKLGEGGMGEVWLAKDMELSQPRQDHLVALKFLSKAIRHDQRALSAIRAEVLSSQALSHPYIVRIFDLHVSPNGMPFIKMEYVEGNSLRHWLRQAPGHVMPWRMVAQLTHQLADALLYAHESAGIVHRDLKPGNLLLAKGQTLKLSDFGIATSLATEATGEIVGTLAYASPQQLAGAAPTPADDVYSLGATLYELLTGTPPFSGRTPEEIISRVRSEEPEPIPQRLESLCRENPVPPKLLILVQKCLEKDPLCRPRTQDISNLLPAVIEHRAAVRVRISPELPSDLEEEKPASMVWVWTKTVLVLLLAGLGVWGWSSDWAGLRTHSVAQWEALMDLHPPSKSAHGLDSKADSQDIDRLTKSKSDDVSGRGDNPKLAAIVPAAWGAAVIRITSAAQGRKPHAFAIRDAFGSNVASGILPTGQALFTNALRVGSYRVLVAEETNWISSSTAEVKSNQASIVDAVFRYESLTVWTEPAEARVTWDPDRFGGTNDHAPFTRRFASGSIQFTIKKEGYPELKTNYLFDPTVSTNLVINLRRSSSPLKLEDWTNSLGMSFHWIDSLSLWACRTETRVSDFRQFAESAVPDMGGEMYCISTNGSKEAANSWRNPGFPQSDDHPVVGVNWHDATAFCTWLTKVEWASGGLKSNMFYWLPSTNQWFELAGGRRFPWGDEPDALEGNYSGPEAATQAWPPNWPVIRWHTNDDCARTAPAFSMRANAHGLYHVGGNAAEWCAEAVLCGRSWCDGESDNPKQDLAPLDFLETRRVQTVDPKERNDRSGFRIVIYPGEGSLAH